MAGGPEFPSQSFDIHEPAPGQQHFCEIVLPQQKLRTGIGVGTTSLEHSPPCSGPATEASAHGAVGAFLLKLAGAYGDNQTQLRRFRERLGANGQSFDAAEEASRVAD